MPYRKKKKKITKRDLKLFAVMLLVALVCSALLAMFTSQTSNMEEMVRNAIVNEYKHRTGKDTVDPGTMKIIDRTAEEIVN